MNKAEFRFYEELNDFLPKDKKKVAFSYAFYGNPTIKQIVEQIGIPHSQIDLILVNSESVDFHYLLQDQDRVSVYPMFEAMDITPIIKLQPKPLRNMKFILDCHLGKMAKYLRLLGFDSLYENPMSDDEIIKISLASQRIILTRDKGLLKSNLVQRGYWLRATDPHQQIKELLNHFDLKNNLNPFTRCLNCNSVLVPADKNDVNLPDSQIKKRFEKFNKCEVCQKIYWEGSHYHNMQKIINKFLEG